MGEARRRGTYKQRKAMAVEKGEKAYLVAKIESLRPKPKSTMTKEEFELKLAIAFGFIPKMR